MATKIIKAWIDGAIQEIEVEDITSPAQPLSVEERIDTLEDKHEVIVTKGNLLVGDGTPELKEITPNEVLSHINGASVMTLTTEEYEALEETNANTLYMLTDADDASDDVVLTTEQTLTEEQKAQARANIGVVEKIEDALFSLNLVVPITEEDGSLAENDDTLLVVRNDGIFLPEVTDENDGKVLKVVDGKWAIDDIGIPEIPAQVQADWNQNDSTQLDFIQNKTHYIETKQVSETRTFTEPFIQDLEFAKLLYEHRKDAIYNLSGENYIYSMDLEAPGYAWELINESTGEPSGEILLPSSTEPPDITLIGDIVFAPDSYITVNYEVEEVHKLDTKYLPDDVCTQSDWNQNDSTKRDYIKNRTHWVESPVVIEFEENKYVTDADIVKFIFENRETAKLTVDGTEHYFNCDETVNSDYLEFSVRDENDESRYRVCAQKNKGSSEIDMAWAETYDKTSGITATIKIEGLLVHKIDEKFIPDSIARKEDIVRPDWNQNDSTQLNYIQNRTHYVNTICETREFVADSSDGGRITDLDFAIMLWNNRATATYYANGEQFQYVEGDGGYANGTKGYKVKNTNSQAIFFISINFDTGLIIFGNPDGSGTFANGSITVAFDSIKQLDEMFIPDTIARTSDIQDAQVQSDWNQNDSTQLNYIQNRTHWEEKEYAVIKTLVDNKEFTTSLSSDNRYECSIGFALNQENGFLCDDTCFSKLYHVRYNDEDYYLNPATTTNNGLGKYLGNPYIYNQQNTDLGLPFCIRVGSYGAVYCITRNAETFTLTLCEVEEHYVVHKLDKKYLPDDVYTQPDWNQNDETTVDYVKNRTHYDSREFVGIDIVFDGNIDDVEILLENGGYFAKISNLTPSREEVIGSLITIGDTDAQVITEDIIRLSPDGSCWSLVTGGKIFICVLEEGASGLAANKTLGIWSHVGDDSPEGAIFYNVPIVIEKALLAGELKQLDKKYLPDDVILEGEVVTVPATATVGQTIVVKSVDDNGKPTEWEAVDPFVLTDESTGVKYKLSVIDSKVTLTEVT